MRKAIRIYSVDCGGERIDLCVHDDGTCTLYCVVEDVGPYNTTDIEIEQDIPRAVAAGYLWGMRKANCGYYKDIPKYRRSK